MNFRDAQADDLCGQRHGERDLGIVFQDAYRLVFRSSCCFH